ncbi:MAG: DUF423 domain-containing protein [Sphingomicrobium sp.]
MLGAFGAHGLAARLTAQQLSWWQTAVEYQMWHALALLLVAVLPIPRSGLIAGLFGVGTLIFAGTLYAMALGAPRLLGAITPIGGLLMIGGWLLLCWEALKPLAGHDHRDPGDH